MSNQKASKKEVAFDDVHSGSQFDLENPRSGNLVSMVKLSIGSARPTYGGNVIPMRGDQTVFV